MERDAAYKESDRDRDRDRDGDRELRIEKNTERRKKCKALYFLLIVEFSSSF